MPQFLEIEGDLVRVVERSVINTANLADVLPLLENRPPITMLHPRSAILTQWDESDPAHKRVKFLCEYAPGIRAITKGPRRYRLAMPWTYFIFGFETAGPITGPGSQWSMGDHLIFHTNEKVRNLNSRLWTAFLPNVYEDGRICFGSTGADISLSLSDRVDELVNTWYMTEFNNDVIGGRTHPMPFNAPFPTPGFRPWVEATATLGAAAWTTFPEWNNTTSSQRAAGPTSFTVQELFHVPLDRLAPITMQEAIPPLALPMTFGRTEDWLRSLTPLQRRQIATGITHIATETPDAIAPVEAIPAPPTMEDDGGEPI